jgi:hypothetical protein
MADSLASFRDLKGIGPATEARLHENGIYTWEALAAAATALAAVGGKGDTPRDVAGMVAAQRAEAGSASTAPRRPGRREHLEAFVVRMSLTADGDPRRSEVTHVRTMTGQPWEGWQPAELVEFIQKHSGVRVAAVPQPEPARADAPRPTQRRRDPEPAGTQAGKSPAKGATADHLIVLDAGKAIGGESRDIDLVVTNTRAAGGDFDYRATLATRPLGSDRNGDGWTPVATHTGTGSAAHEVPLRFPAVHLPRGIQRLQLRLEVKLPAPARRPPALALA